MAHLRSARWKKKMAVWVLCHFRGHVCFNPLTMQVTKAASNTVLEKLCSILSHADGFAYLGTAAAPCEAGLKGDVQKG